MITSQFKVKLGIFIFCTLDTNGLINILLTQSILNTIHKSLTRSVLLYLYSWHSWPELCVMCGNRKGISRWPCPILWWPCWSCRPIFLIFSMCERKFQTFHCWENLNTLNPSSDIDPCCWAVGVQTLHIYSHLVSYIFMYTIPAWLQASSTWATHCVTLVMHWWRTALSFSHLEDF